MVEDSCASAAGHAALSRESSRAGRAPPARPSAQNLASPAGRADAFRASAVWRVVGADLIRALRIDEPTNSSGSRYMRSPLGRLPHLALVVRLPHSSFSG